MKPSWRRRFADHEQILRQIDSRLVLCTDELPRTVTGAVDVPIGAGRTQAVPIRIVFEEGSPFRMPRAYLADDTFPPEDDRHIRGDHWLCMWLPQTTPAYFDSPRGMEAFISDLSGFLVLQFVYDDRKSRDIKPYWVGLEWGHGADGHRQWLREHVADIPLPQLRQLVEAMHMRLRRTAPCPCGRRLPYGRCHLVWLRRLRTVVTREPAAWAELQTILGDAPAVVL